VLRPPLLSTAEASVALRHLGRPELGFVRQPGRAHPRAEVPAERLALKELAVALQFRVRGDALDDLRAGGAHQLAVAQEVRAQAMTIAASPSGTRRNSLVFESSVGCASSPRQCSLLRVLVLCSRGPYS
jgi:hypothetical protein